MDLDLFNIKKIISLWLMIEINNFRHFILVITREDPLVEFTKNWPVDYCLLTFLVCKPPPIYVKIK